MFEFKRYIVQIFLIGVVFFTITLNPANGEVTWFWGSQGINSSGSQVSTYTFTMPNGPDTTIKWSCDLTDAIKPYNYGWNDEEEDSGSIPSGWIWEEGFFRISDNLGNIIVDQIVAAPSGWDEDETYYEYSNSFLGKAGVTYTVQIRGGYCYYDIDDGWSVNGIASGSVSFMYPEDGTIYDMDLGGGSKNDSHFLYLPDPGFSTGYYKVPNNHTFNSQDLKKALSYPIPIFWEVSFSRKNNSTHRTDPWFHVEIINPDGLSQMVVDESRRNSSTSGNFILPAGCQMKISDYTGKWEQSDGVNKDDGGYRIHYKIKYRLDDENPGIPGKVIPSGVSPVNGIYYAKHNSNKKVAVQFAAAEDEGPLFGNGLIEFETVSGIDRYVVYCNGAILTELKTTPDNQDDDIFYGEIPLNQGGPYNITINAVDKADNPGDTSVSSTIFVDLDPPTIQGIPDPTAVNGDIKNGYTKSNQITWNWNAGDDGTAGSGVSSYLVSIKSTDNTDVIANWVKVTTTSYLQTSAIDGKTYKCEVKAVDKAGNIGNPISAVIRIDRSIQLPANYTTFPKYSLKLNGTDLTMIWNSITETGGVGIASYDVALTESAQPPQVAGGNTSNNFFEFKNVSITVPHYGWVKAKDRLGNEGSWQMVGPFPFFTFTGPQNGLVTCQSEQGFSLDNQNNPDLRFQVYYQLNEANPQISTINPETVNFSSEGVYQWWLEIAEYINGVKEPASVQITPKYTISIDKTKPTGTFTIKSTDGTKEYNETNPSNTQNVKIYISELNDSGAVQSGVNGIYLWNGDPTPIPASSYMAKDDIPANGISWTLQDGQNKVNMVIKDNAGNLTTVTRTVTLDRVAPPAPTIFPHTQGSGAITFNWGTVETSDVFNYKGSYQVFNEAPVNFTVFPSTNKTGSQLVPYDINKVGHNKPVKIIVKAVDAAGNESAPVDHTAYTPASLGQLGFPSGGYDPDLGRHFLKWELTQADSSITYKLEYSNIDPGNGSLTIQGEISLENGYFLLDQNDGTAQKLQPHDTYWYRLVAINQSDDRTYGAIGTVEIPNCPPSVPEPTYPLQYAKTNEHGVIEFLYNTSSDNDVTDSIVYSIYVGAGDNPTEYKELTQFLGTNHFAHDHTYAWYVTADDQHGSVISSQPVYFIVDKNVPALTIEEVKRPYTNQSQITITANDDLSGIREIRYQKIDTRTNEPISSGLLTLSESADKQKQGVFELAEGNYHLKFTAVDQAGNEADKDLNNLNIDHTKPIVTDIQVQLAQQDGSYLCNLGTVPVKWNATDTASGVRNLCYWVVETPNSKLEDGKVLPLSNGLNQYNYTLDLPGINGNQYYLAMAIEDRAGNRSDVHYLGPILRDTTAATAELELTGLQVYGSNCYLTSLGNLEATVIASDPESDINEEQIRYAIINVATGIPVNDWGSWADIQQAILTNGNIYQVAVRVSNGVQLITEVRSETFTFDETAPEQVALIIQTNTLASGEIGIFSASASEPESIITAYWLALGTEDDSKKLSAQIPGNQNGWLVMHANQQSASFRIEIPNTPNGEYLATVRVDNAAGLSNTISNQKFTIKNNQNKPVVGDQGPYAMLSDGLTGWWRFDGDPQASGFQYRILCQDQAVTEWRSTKETEVTVADLTLQTGQLYRFEVKALFAEGGSSESGYSPGVMLDKNPATITKLETPQYATSDNLTFNWEGNDPESGISVVEAALGSDFYNTDISEGWVRVIGNQSKLSHTANGTKLNLKTGQKYYLTLRVTNGAGLTSEMAAPAIIVDNTPPPLPVVVDQGSYINNLQPLEAHWIWSPVDQESGVTYQWAILESGAELDNVTWETGNETLRTRLENFEQQHGRTYYFAVKATNGAGLTCIGMSDGIMVDATAPLIPRVLLIQAVNYGSPQNGEDINYITETDGLELWIDSQDLDSGLSNRYQYAYGERETVDQANETESTDAEIRLGTLTIDNNQIYIFKGECYNNADLISQPGYSTGVILDTGAPAIVDLHGGVSGNRIMFDWNVVESNSPVAGYEVALVPEDRWNTKPSDSEWEKVGLNRSIVIDGTDLADGYYRLWVRGYNRAGTYSRWDSTYHECGISPRITLDRTAPKITQLYYDKYASSQMVVWVAAEDNLSGINSYQYALGSRVNPIQFSEGWKDIQIEDGQFQVATGLIPHKAEVFLLVRVKDNVGLWSTAQMSQKILIDQTVPSTPEVTCGGYTRSLGDISEINFNSTDPESGLTHYRLGLVAEKGEQWLVTEEKPIGEFNNCLTGLNMVDGKTYYLAFQTRNGAGDWSSIGYSQPITVDITDPVLEFTLKDRTIVTNNLPLSIEYTLREAVTVKFIISGADGSMKEYTPAGTVGTNQFQFSEAKQQTYTITARYLDLAGNPGVDKTQLVRVNAPPQIIMAAIDTTPGQPLQLRSKIIDPDGTSNDRITYQFIPGDGNQGFTGELSYLKPVEGETISYQLGEYRYTSLGQITLTLTVTDADGGIATQSVPVTVHNTIKGSLYMDEVWSGVHQIYGDVIVPAGIKLTITPGTQVIVDGIPGDGYFHSLIINGNLEVQGTGVSFSSVTGQSGGWRGIYIEGQAVLNGADIRHAERGLAVINNANVTVSGCTFADNKAGIHVYIAKPVIHSSVFQNNIWYGIKEDEGGRPTVTGCTFESNNINYYHETLTAITIEQLNQITGNSGNHNR